MLRVTTESFKNQKRFIAHNGANPNYFVYVKQKKSHMLNVQKQPLADVFQNSTGVLKNFTIFTEKDQRWSLYLIKLQGCFNKVAGQLY